MIKLEESAENLRRKVNKQADNVKQAMETKVLFTNNKRLYRSRKDRVLAGVCGGLGEFFGVDATLVRIVFILLALWGGMGIVLYLLMWLVVPEEGESFADVQERVRKGAQEMRTKAEGWVGTVQGLHTSSQEEKKHSRQWMGTILLMLGIIFLLNNFGLARWLNMGKLWPVLLIGLGAVMLWKKK